MTDHHPSSEGDFHLTAEELLEKSRYDHIGQQSLDRLVEGAAEDRIASKRTVKLLSQYYGAPGTRENQALWSNRFNTFRKETLKQDLSRPLTADDLIRFLDVIIGYMKTAEGKPGPSLSVIQTASKIIIQQEKFRCAAFHFTHHYAQRLTVFLDRSVRDGRLTKGIWKKRQYLGFMMVSRIAKSWLQYHLNNGVNSWDRPLARLLSVLLVSCTAARSGDIGRARNYQGMECLRWEHLDLFIDDSDPTSPPIESLQLHITLRYTKGYKDEPNNNREVSLARLPNRFLHCDPILLVLIHALRFGLVEGGPSIEGVIDTAMSRNDRTIQWLSPELPVCPAFNRGGSPYAKLEEPANSKQINKSLQSMAVVSGVLCHISSHSLRYGSARDIAHLPEKSEGYTNNTVRQAIGHTAKTYASGITQAYVGESERHVWNDRAELGYRSRQDPKFAETPLVDIVNKSISQTEIDDWFESQPVGSAERSERQVRTISMARNSIRAARLDSVRKTVNVETPQAARDSVSTKLTIKTMTPLRSWSNSEKNSSKEKELPPIQQESTIDLRAINDFEGAVDDEDPDTIIVPEELLDPLVDLVFNQPAPDNMMKDIRDKEVEDAPMDDAWIDEPTDEVEQMVLDQGCELVDAEELGALEFVRYFSELNVTNHAIFSRAFERMERQNIKEGDEEIMAQIPHANSRQNPTPFTFVCSTAGCEYSSNIRGLLKEHRSGCTAETVAKAQDLRARQEFPCLEPGCKSSFTTVYGRNHHMKKHDKSNDRPCPDGCQPGKLFSREALQTHMKGSHPIDEFAQRSCPFPKSCSKKTFNSRRSYEKHLRVQHGLATVASRKPFMPTAITDHKFRGGLCEIDACEHKGYLANWTNLALHLSKGHPLFTTEQRRIAYRSRAEVDVSMAKRMAEDGEGGSQTKKARVDEEEI
ncbi:MAG: hypothetical protein Q9176_007909 [Flavoplaca citrina]